MLAFTASGMAAATAFRTGMDGARAAGAKTLRLGHWLPAQHPMALYLQGWADVFPAGQLGPVPEYYDMVRRGIVDIGFILHGSTSDRFPLTSLMDLPFMVESAAHGTKVLNDPAVRAVLDPEHRGLHVLYLLTHQPGQLSTVDREVRSPADLAGLRIRFPSGTIKTYLEALGASTVGLPPSAIAENIQKRVIDGVMIDYGGAGIAYRLGGAIGHVLELGAYTTSFGLVMNPDARNGLPGDLRQLLDKSVTGVEAEVAANWDGLDAPGKAALVEGGAKIVLPTAEERAPFIATGVRVTETVLKEREAGHSTARDVYGLMRAAAEKYRA
jgi:TRAP-type C4-dicarboxylate transport system substrate-binding protein